MKIFRGLLVLVYVDAHVVRFASVSLFSCDSLIFVFVLLLQLESLLVDFGQVLVSLVLLQRAMLLVPILFFEDGEFLVLLFLRREGLVRILSILFRRCQYSGATNIGATTSELREEEPS